MDEQSTGRVVFDLLGIVCIALYDICTSHASQSDVDIQLVKVVVVEYNMDGRYLLSSHHQYILEHPSNALSIPHIMYSPKLLTLIYICRLLP